MKDQGEKDALRVKKFLEEEEQKILKKNRLNGVNNKIGEMKKSINKMEHINTNTNILNILIECL